MSKLLDLTGQKFGKLTVIGGFYPDKGKQPFWKCRCECGNEVDVRSYALRSGNTRSCGCLRRESTSKRFKTHEMSHSKAYGVWQTMLSRCTNPKTHAYKNYGGRGIKVCDDWRKDFAWFYVYMGDPPPGCWLERIDNDGDYTPDNCRWATPTEQLNNTKRNVRIVHNGETKTVAEWGRHFGISRNAIATRLKAGYDLETGKPMKANK